MLRPPLTVLKLTLLPLLQRHFDEPIGRGELDFLLGRKIELKLQHLPWPLALSLQASGLELDWSSGDCDACFSGTPVAMIQLAFGQADGDALFFQRKLTMEGDTALALEVKGLLGRYPLPLNLLPLLRPA